MQIPICGPTKHNPHESEVILGLYADDTLCLLLVDPETKNLNLTASVNMTETQPPPPEDHIYIKNWSENTGVLGALILAEIIEPPLCHVQAGFSSAALCRLIGPILSHKEHLQCQSTS